jgi:hypothetical protein
LKGRSCTLCFVRCFTRYLNQREDCCSLATSRLCSKALDWYDGCHVLQVVENVFLASKCCAPSHDYNFVRRMGGGDLCSPPLAHWRSILRVTCRKSLRQDHFSTTDVHAVRSSPKSSRSATDKPDRCVVAVCCQSIALTTPAAFCKAHQLGADLAQAG